MGIIDLFLIKYGVCKNDYLIHAKIFKNPIYIQIAVSFRKLISYVMGSKNALTTACGCCESADSGNMRNRGHAASSPLNAL